MLSPPRKVLANKNIQVARTIAWIKKYVKLLFWQLHQSIFNQYTLCITTAVTTFYRSLDFPLLAIKVLYTDNEKMVCIFATINYWYSRNTSSWVKRFSYYLEMSYSNIDGKVIFDYVRILGNNPLKSLTV